MVTSADVQADQVLDQLKDIVIRDPVQLSLCTFRRSTCSIDTILEVETDDHAAELRTESCDAWVFGLWDDSGRDGKAASISVELTLEENESTIGILLLHRPIVVETAKVMARKDVAELPKVRRVLLPFSFQK